MTKDRIGVLEVSLTSYKMTVDHSRCPNCPRCGSELELHQPDLNLPDRLLGTCPDCSEWVVIESEGLSSAWCLELPGVAEARGAVSHSVEVAAI